MVGKFENATEERNLSANAVEFTEVAAAMSWLVGLPKRAAAHTLAKTVASNLVEDAAFQQEWPATDEVGRNHREFTWDKA